MKISFKNENGFTLIETLVAITILMISIAGPLTIAQKSLRAATTAKDQVIASFLAQDKMEQIKNDRDNSITGDNPISFSDWLNRWISNYNSNTDCVSSPCTLFSSTDGTYGNDPSGTLTRFSRQGYVKSVNDHEALVIVIVKWSNGTVENTVKLQNYLFNVQL